MSTRCSIFEMSKLIQTDQRCYAGGRTKFDRWSDCPLSTEMLYEKNRKRYPHVKSRYMEPGRPVQKMRHGYTMELQDPDKKCRMLKQERDRLASYDTMNAKRMAMLSPAEYIYLDMLEADGRLDELAAALGYLIAIDIERVKQRQWSATVHSVQSDAQFLNIVKNTLFAKDSDLPSALLRMAFAFTSEEHWLWVIELCLMTALSQLADGGRDEAICLFVTGQFYATTEAIAMHTHWSVSRPARLLERARRVADNHRRDWYLPAYVRNADWVRAMVGGGVWSSICFAEYKVLLDAANILDPARAVQAVQAASRLLELCDAGDHYRAAIEYELGIKYMAVGLPGKATEAFTRCADMTVAMGNIRGSDLDLEARLEAARTFPILANDIVLEWVTNEALKRHNHRLLVKAIMGRARLDAYNNRPRKAYRRFALAYRLAVPVDNAGNAYMNKQDSNKSKSGENVSSVKIIKYPHPKINIIP